MFASKGISQHLIVMATSETAAASINGITIHSACSMSKDASRTGFDKNIDRVRVSRTCVYICTALYYYGQVWPKDHAVASAQEL